MNIKYEKFEKENFKAFSNLVVKNFHQVFLFYSFCVAFCAVRAPTDFAVAVTYSSIIAQVAFTYGGYLNKPIISVLSFGLIAVLNLVLILTALFHRT